MTTTIHYHIGGLHCTVVYLVDWINCSTSNYNHTHTHTPAFRDIQCIRFQFTCLILIPLHPHLGNNLHNSIRMSYNYMSFHDAITHSPWCYLSQYLVSCTFKLHAPVVLKKHKNIKPEVHTPVIIMSCYMKETVHINSKNPDSSLQPELLLTAADIHLMLTELEKDRVIIETIANKWLLSPLLTKNKSTCQPKK